MSLPAEDTEAKLIELSVSCRSDPLRYVKAAYPWGDPGSLEKWTGPDVWQEEVLACIRDNISRTKPLLIAVAGGNGPGKSALASWIVDWAMSTAPDTRINVTANTGPQLSTKTWPEISKWHNLSLFGSWFELGHRRLRSVDAENADTWRCDAITWEEETAEAFQGLHNAGKRMLFVFDESSAIPDAIWDAQEGSLTDVDTEIVWLCLGNPTRATGRFRECFPGGRRAKNWKTFNIDTRKARMANQDQIKDWIESYGIDSDFVRVRVLSQFPRAGSMQFIPSDLVERAASPDRDPPVTLYDPLVMGVDVARFGDDKTVIRFRRGRDARSIPPIKLRGQDGIQVAGKVAELWRLHKPDAIFVDGGGLGASAVDHLRYLKVPFMDIQFGGSADREPEGVEATVFYGNKRAEMYGTMRDWLRGDVMIDDDPELKADLVAVEYGYSMINGRDVIILEKKEHMKKRGLASPDDSDGLALTFAHPVGMSDHSYQFTPGKTQHEYSYDPCQSR